MKVSGKITIIDALFTTSALGTSNRVGISRLFVDEGLTPSGIDLGSPRSVPLHAPSVAVFAGSPLSAYRVGEVWHLLDQRMRMPVTMVDAARLGKTELDDYSIIVLAGGSYSRVSSVGS